MNAISNPKKSLTVSFSNEDVKTSLKSLTTALSITGRNGYLQESFDEFLGELRLLKTELLSLGVRIIINTNYINDTTTQIDIEVQRMVGSFNTSAEVTLANQHLQNITKALSLALQTKGDMTLPEVQVAREEGLKVAQQNESANLFVFALIIGGIMLAVLMN